MNPDLYIVRKVNEATSISRKGSLFMDLVTRYGHWAFVIYGLLLWFAPGEGRKARRLCCVLSFAGVVAASLLSFAIGKVWSRRRPFVCDWRIWNFTGHKANASFPSNHTMNGAIVVMELLRMHMPGARLMAAFAGLLAFSRIFAGVHYPTDLLGGVAIAGLVHRLIHAAPCAAALAAVASFASAVSDWVFSRK